MILITFLTLISGVISFLVGLSYIEENVREGIEHDRPCESHRILKWTSIFSKESQYLLGNLYSRGTCFTQNIQYAKGLYTSVYEGDSVRIAQALFHDAIQLADFDERRKVDRRPENIRALLVESRRMGFRPSDRELRDLEGRGLTRDFMSAFPEK